MPGIEPLTHDEDAAALRLLHVATEDVFEAGPPRRGRPQTALLLDPPDDSAQIGDGELGAHGHDGSAPAGEALEKCERHRLGAAADVVHRPHARRTPAAAGAGLERLARAREQIGQHLEDALGEADAPGWLSYR